LKARRPAQRRDLPVAKHSPVPRLEAAETKRPVGGSVERNHSMADREQHASNLAVPALANHNAHL